MKRLSMVAALCAALAACGPARDGANGTAATNAGQGNAAATTRGAAVVLTAGGLQMANGMSPRVIEFGAPAAEAVAQLEAALGAAQQEHLVAGCRTLSWATESDPTILDIHVRDGRFAGYHAGPGYRTAEGIGVGSTRGEFEDRHVGATSSVDAMGQPVLSSQGGLRVVVEGAERDSGIVALMAGENCPA